MIAREGLARAQLFVENTFGEQSREAKETREAIAAVAELIEVSRELLEYRVGTYPTRGDLRDNAGSRAQIDALATSLARVGGSA